MKRTAYVLGALLLGGVAIGQVEAQDATAPQGGGMVQGRDTMQGQCPCMGMMDQGMMGEGMTGQGMMGRGMMGQGAGGSMMGQRMFGMMDADDDGAVTEAEFLDGHRKRFSTADADGDGRVTQEEMQRAMRAMHGQGASGGTAGGATTVPAESEE